MLAVRMLGRWEEQIWAREPESGPDRGPGSALVAPVRDALAQVTTAPIPNVRAPVGADSCANVVLPLMSAWLSRPPSLGADRTLTRAQVHALLNDKGIDPAGPWVRELLDEAFAEGPTLDVARFIDRFVRAASRASSIQGGQNPVAKAFSGSLAVPNWKEFMWSIEEIFLSVKREVSSGAQANYIPILATQV
jgi:hypothetical protein